MGQACPFSTPNGNMGNVSHADLVNKRRSTNSMAQDKPHRRYESAGDDACYQKQNEQKREE